MFPPPPLPVGGKVSFPPTLPVPPARPALHVHDARHAHAVRDGPHVR